MGTKKNQLWPEEAWKWREARLGRDREACAASLCFMFTSLFWLPPLSRMPYGTGRVMWALGGGRDVGLPGSEPRAPN